MARSPPKAYLLLGFAGCLLRFRSCVATQTESIVVSTTICSRFAETTVHSLFVNDGLDARQAEFKVLLPHEAFVTEYSLEIDGVWHDGVVEERAKAARQFAIAKEMGVAGGQLGSEGIWFKTFKTKTIVEAGKKIQWRMVYQQLLRRTNNKYQHEVILLGSQLTKELEIEVHICESKRIYNVKALPILSGDGKQIKPVVDIEHIHDNSASLYFLPSDDERSMKSLLRFGGRFVVQYELDQNTNGQLIVGDKNFIQFFAPPVDIKPRRILFLLDVSGSMFTDDKITHLKTAMYNLIRKLSKKDRFGIISFHTNHTVWETNSKQMSPGTAANVNSAIRFIRGLHAEGYTAFYEPIVKALRILEQDTGSEQDDPRSNYIVLVTDGRPKVSPDAEVDENQWLHNISNINKGRFAIHAIGLGSDVDSKAMSLLTAENEGTWRQLSSGVNTAVQIQTYLEELGTRLLSNISLSHPDVVTSRTILPPVHFGGEYIVTGTLRKSINAQEAENLLIVREEPSGEVKLTMEFSTENTFMQCAHVERATAATFTEKAHALATVMDILRLIDQSQGGVKERAKLRAHVIKLAKRHHLVTPLTSMVVFRPEDRKRIEIKYTMETHSPVASTAPPVTTTRWVIPGWGFQGDPHFFVRLEKNLTACFEFPGSEGEIFNFLHDPDLGITVNGKATRPVHEKKKRKVIPDLYITELVVLLKKENILLLITPNEITAQELHARPNKKPVLHLSVKDIEDYRKSYESVTISVRNSTSQQAVVSVFLASKAKFELRMALFRPPNTNDHINLEVFGISVLSKNVGGIFGHFPRKTKPNEMQLDVVDHDRARLKVRGQWVEAYRAGIRVHFWADKTPCWHFGDIRKLLGFGLKRFKLDSMLEEPDGRHKLGK